MSNETATTGTRPKVLIVGAGLGGVTLGILLEKAGVPYEIFERAATVKPLGSALHIGSKLLPLFEQIGVYDEYVASSKHMTELRVHNDEREFSHSLDNSLSEELTGYKEYIVARPVLYNILLKQIPPEKIHFSKRVLSISQGDGGVLIRTADGSNHEGDILVGADGAYSAVRKSMYERLKKDNKLPRTDEADLPFSYICTVGQTLPLDPVDFPQLKKRLCEFSWMTFTTAQNTFCWMVVFRLDAVSIKAAENDRSRQSNNSEWGPLAAQAMCQETRDFAIPGGNGTLTLGDLYDKTPLDLMSKVMLEEKVFETWYAGRAVLLGDACHKLNPAGGQGAISAMHDGITLANLIYTLPPSPSQDEITKVFAEYKSERFPVVLEAFNNSKMLSWPMAKGLLGKVARYVVKNLPGWLWKSFVVKAAKERPQVGFLHEIENKGTIAADVQPSFIKAKGAMQRASAI
ncbi:hypothetical protein BGX28_002308 [Mortierella sp. GBA30]|nr:hypothetical protein BGX28_002308 [Mortierella sp. GBA30]